MQRKLGRFDLTMIVISLVIGMGIFKSPVLVAKAALTPGIFYAAWIIGGIIALCGALTFAEIGSRLPVSGGYYRIFSLCFHPSFAFILNCTILVSNAASVAAVALIGSEYIGGIFFAPDDPGIEAKRVWIAAGEILLFFALNMLGIKTSARMLSILTVFKIGIVLLLCLAIFNPSTEYIQTPVMHAAGAEHSWTDWIISLGVCLIPISFTYGGYQQTINFGGDVQDAPKNMPRGIILGIAIVVALYLAINYAYMHSIGFGNLGQWSNIGSTLAKKVLGHLGSQFFTVVFFIAVLAYVNVGLMSNPRVIMAMSEEGVLPKIFSRKDERYGVPVIALVVFTGMCLGILFFAKAFDQIVNYVIFLDSLGLVAAAATLFVLRHRKTGDELQPYRMKLFPVAPVFFMLAYAFVTFSIVLEEPVSVVYGCCILLFFLIVYLLLKAMRKNAQ
jgi:APA family basic amino acid/polyamine antiporter